MRRIPRIPSPGSYAIGAIAVVSALALTAGTAAPARGPATAAPPDIAMNDYIFGTSQKLTRLRAGVTYEASQVPIGLRVRPPDGSWLGAQWKTGAYYPAFAEIHHVADLGGPPYFGWLSLGHGTPTGVPQGMVTIMTAYAPTPSVASTVNVLKTRGRGAAYEPTSPVEVAGFSGVQFDGRIVGAKNAEHIGHYFIPFGLSSKAAKFHPAEYPVYGDVFRVIVLDVHGKTVVVFIENVGLPVAEFPDFLTRADQLLASLRFRTKG